MKYTFINCYVLIGKQTDFSMLAYNGIPKKNIYTNNHKPLDISTSFLSRMDCRLSVIFSGSFWGEVAPSLFNSLWIFCPSPYFIPALELGSDSRTVTFLTNYTYAQRHVINCQEKKGGIHPTRLKRKRKPIQILQLFFTVYWHWTILKNSN